MIRLAGPRDSSKIARIHVDTWRRTYKGIMPQPLLDGLSYERREAFWRQAISSPGPKQATFVAEVDAVGLVGFEFVGPERTGDPEYEGEILALYVDGNSQRRGIGRALFETAVNHLRESGFSSLLVWVAAANPYRAFYDKMGGTPAREREVDFGGAPLQEVGYGWADLGELPKPRESREPAA
jgi:ribosomal protein S18 acetylase RimI-like enzyme